MYDFIVLLNLFLCKKYIELTLKKLELERYSPLYAGAERPFSPEIVILNYYYYYYYYGSTSRGYNTKENTLRIYTYAMRGYLLFLWEWRYALSQGTLR